MQKCWPQARITVSTRGLAQKVFETFASGVHLHSPDVVTAEGHSKRACIDPAGDLVVYLRGDVHAVWAVWKRLAARFLCGLPRHSRLRWAPLYYLGLPVPQSREHQYDTFCRMISPFGVELPPWPRITVRREWHESLMEKLFSKGIESRRLAVVHPFVGWAPRAWPWKRWRKICAQMHKELDLQVCLIGGPEDAAALAPRGPDGFSASDFVGELSLGELAALCQRAVLFVGNDSGPAHLAAAAGTRCVVLYGPQEAALFGVRSNRAVALQGRSFCTPCWQKVCPFDRVRCMEEITVDAVRNAVGAALAI
jgi:ADP-heptose:LPS heptosyltransferase